MMSAQPEKHITPPLSSVNLPRNAFTLDLVSKRQNRFIFAIKVFKMANQMGHNE